METFDLTIAEHRLRNPEPGSPIAAARDFGIDLTLLIAKLRLTPEQRFIAVEEAANSLAAIHEAITTHTEN